MFSMRTERSFKTPGITGLNSIVETNVLETAARIGWHP